MKYLILTLLVLAGCTTTPKKSQDNKEVIKTFPEVYEALCYSDNLQKYTLIDGVKVMSVSSDGIHVKIDSEPQEIVVKSSCILENHNSSYKITGAEKPFTFVCVFDNIGDVAFKGEDYMLVRSYEDGAVVDLYNPKDKNEYLVSSDQCQILSDPVKK